MAEYVLKLRLVTEAAPRDTINWDAIALIAAGMFKAKRPAVPIALVSVVMEQVEPTKLTHDPGASPPLSDTPATGRQG